MTFGLNILKDVPDLAVRPNDDRVPPHLAALRAGAVGPAHLAAGIGEQRKWKSIFLRKGRVNLYRVLANAYDLHIQRLKFADSITESGALDDSARCVRLGVKPEYGCFAPIVAQAGGPAGVIFERKAGRHLADG